MVLKSVATLMAGLCLALADSSISSNLPILYRVDQPNSNVVVFRGANVALAKAHGLIPSHSKNDDSDGDDKDKAGEGDDDGHGSNGNGYASGYGNGYRRGYGNNGYNGNRYAIMVGTSLNLLNIPQLPPLLLPLLLIPLPPNIPLPPLTNLPKLCTNLHQPTSLLPTLHQNPIPQSTMYMSTLLLMPIMIGNTP